MFTQPQLPIDLTVPICEFLDMDGIYNWMRVSKKHNELISRAITRTNSVVEKLCCRFNCDDIAIGGNIIKRRAYFEGNEDVISHQYYPNNLTTSGAITLIDDKCHHPVYMGARRGSSTLDTLFVIHCSNGYAKIAAHCNGFYASDLRVYESTDPLHIFDFIDDMLILLFTLETSFVVCDPILAEIVRRDLHIREFHPIGAHLNSPEIIKALDSFSKGQYM